MFKRGKLLPAVLAALVFVVAIMIATACRVGFVVFAPDDVLPASDQVTEIGSNPSQVQLAAFAQDMSNLYQTYDAQRDFIQKVTINSEGLACIVSATQITRQNIASTEDDGTIFVDAAPFIEALGYESEGISAIDGAITLADGLTIEATTRVKDDYTYYSAQDIALALGCEVSCADDGSVSVTFPYQSARIIVKTYNDIIDSAALSNTQSIDGVHVLQYATAFEAKAACEKFSAQDGVISACPDAINFLAENASDEDVDEDVDVDWEPEAALSWGNEVVGSTQAQLDLVNQYGGEGNIPSVTVAVIDTGIDLNHEYLQNRLVSGCDFYDNDTDPTDEDGHGTHCAGIIANNTTSNVSIMPLRAGTGLSIPDTAVYSSIEYAINYDVDIISMSFGSDRNSFDSWVWSIQYDAIRDAESAGILMVAAAGNDSVETSMVFPASDAATISVSAIDSDLAFARFSNYGAAIDLCAPGEDINSASLGGGFVKMDGTSMAAPFVAACAALVYSQEGGQATASSVRLRLQNGAIDLGDAGWDKYFGYGCVTLKNLTSADEEAVCRIGSVLYDSLSAAYEAAVDGNTIVLVADVFLDETLTLEKDITITSERSQTITRADGFTGQLLDVRANVVLGSAQDTAKHLYVYGSAEEDARDTLINVESEADLTLLGSVDVGCNSGVAAIINAGTLKIEGAQIVGCEDAQTMCSVNSSGNVALDLNPVLGAGIFLRDDATIAFGEGFDTSLEAINVALERPEDGRVVATFNTSDTSGLLPFYLTDASWSLTQEGANVLLKEAASYDAKIGDVTYDSLSDAVEAALDGDTLTICRNIVLNQSITIDKSIKLTSEGANTISVIDGGSGYAFAITVDAIVVVEGVGENSLVIDGLNKQRSDGLILVDGGALTLGQNVVIARSCADGSALTNCGALIVSGAKIAYNSSGGNGGAICNYGQLTMTSGEVSNNTSDYAGGGIFNVSSCELLGGTIKGNSATNTIYGDSYSGSGGGVFNSGEGRLIIGGASIVDNKAAVEGAGVDNLGYAELNAGCISGNIVGDYGDDGGMTSYEGCGSGIACAGTFIVNGGEVSNNTGFDTGGITSVGAGSVVINTGSVQGNYCTGSQFYLDIFISGDSFLLRGGDAGTIYISDYSYLSLSGSPLVTGEIYYYADAAIQVVGQMELSASIPLRTGYLDDGKILVEYAEGLRVNQADFVSTNEETDFTAGLTDCIVADGQFLKLKRVALKDWGEGDLYEPSVPEDITVEEVMDPYGEKVTSLIVKVPASAVRDNKVTLPVSASEALAVGSLTITSPANTVVTLPIEGEENVSDLAIYVVDAQGVETVLRKCGVLDAGVTFKMTDEQMTISIKRVVADFSDVASTDWFAKSGAVDFAYSRGLITGVEVASGVFEFRGNATLSRAMLATMLYRLEDEPASDVSVALEDVATDAWYADAATWASGAGIIKGYNNVGIFGGDDDATREQLAVVLMRYAQWLGLDTSARADLSGYSDAGRLTFGRDAMSWCVAEGLICGYGNTDQLGPANTTTRAEAATVIQRLVALMLD